jgi:ATPase subunit of ABC transporter with duplicated ATPase domains
LDVTAREAAEEALAAFPGAVIVATHDRFFIDKVCGSIWHLEKGKLHIYEGSYAEFRARVEAGKQRYCADEEDTGGTPAGPGLPGDLKAVELALRTKLAYIASRLGFVDDEAEKLRLESEYEETLAKLRRLERD